MSRRRKHISEIQGHRTKKELAERAEADLIDRIPTDFPSTPPGLPEMPPLLGPQAVISKRLLFVYMDARKMLIATGRSCVGDHGLLMAFLEATTPGKEMPRYAQALDEMVAGRTAYVMPHFPSSPRKPRKPELRPEHDDGLRECVDLPNECVAGRRICPECVATAKMVADDDAEDLRLYPARLEAYEGAMRDWRAQVQAIKTAPLVPISD